MPQPKKPLGLSKPKIPMSMTETGRVISKAENDFRKKSSSDAMNAQFFSRPENANKKKANMYQMSADMNWKKADSAKKANAAEVKKYAAEMKLKSKKK